MLSYSEIFNIQKTTLPVNKKELEKILAKKSFMGYVQCPYSQLVDTLKNISKAEEYEISINPNELYAQGNNPFSKADVYIQVEGLRSFGEFIDHIVQKEDEKEWTDFVTYSETFKDEIRNLKSKVIQKYLWNTQNISNWFAEKAVKLPNNAKQELIQNFDTFRKTVLLSSDLYSFIDCCDEGELKTAVKVLVKAAVEKLDKYKHELNHHVQNNTKRETSIVVKHPVVNRIFISSSFARQCEKEWPKIRFTSLDKRSLETLSLWDEV